MSSYRQECERNANLVLGALPKDLGIRRYHLHDGLYDLKSIRCVIRLGFAKSESSRLAGISLFEPWCENQERDGLALWVLRHIRGVRDIAPVKGGPFVQLGRLLAESFADMLHGDFSVRPLYEKYYGRILDRMGEVRVLPREHPTLIRYENYDLQWLSDLEESRDDRE